MPISSDSTTDDESEGAHDLGLVDKQDNSVQNWSVISMHYQGHPDHSEGYIATHCL